MYFYVFLSVQMLSSFRYVINVTPMSRTLFLTSRSKMLLVINVCMGGKRGG